MWICVKENIVGSQLGIMTFGVGKDLSLSSNSPTPTLECLTLIFSNTILQPLFGISHFKWGWGVVVDGCRWWDSKSIISPEHSYNRNTKIVFLKKVKTNYRRLLCSRNTVLTGIYVFRYLSVWTFCLATNWLIIFFCFLSFHLFSTLIYHKILWPHFMYGLASYNWGYLQIFLLWKSLY